jgi:S-adenosylmethionine:diacylglycerol 3-amino-3-carboxypropyl transferase
MSLHRNFVLRDAPYYRQVVAYLGANWQAHARAGRPLSVTVTEHRATRTAGQNARMWAMLNDVARQVDWYGRRLAPEEWKDVFTAALKRQKVVPGLDGGFVVLGASSREMTVAEMSELMELIEAFGAEHGVRFGEVERPEGAPA